MELIDGRNVVDGRSSRTRIALHHNAMPSHRQTMAVALRHHQAGQLSQAEAGYRQVLADEPNHADALHFLGLVAHQVGRQQEAIECMARAVSQRPRQAEFHNALGGAFAAARRLDEAVASYQSAIELKPGYAPALNNLGNVFQEQGNTEAAVDAYRRALAARPDYVHALNNLGTALRALGDLQAAESCFQRVVELAPHFAQAHTNLALLRIECDPDAALEHARKAVEISPDDATAVCVLGKIYRTQGQLGEAASAFRRALEREPDCVEALNQLADILLQEEKHDESLALCRQATARSRDSAVAHFCLANVLREQGELGEAIREYRLAVRLEPERLEPRLNLAATLREAGQLDEALDCCREAVGRNVDAAGAHNALAGLLKQLDALDEAAAAAQRAVDLDSELVEAHFNLGTIRQRQGRLDEAIDALERALDLDPDYIPARNNLAVVYQYRDEVEQAAACFARLQYIEPHQPIWELREATLWPTVFESAEAIDEHGRRVAKELERIGALPIRIKLDDAAMLGGGPPFNLQFYHGDVRPLREAYARLFRGVFPREALPPRAEAPRVGVLVTRGNESLFLRSLGGVLNRLDTTDFELCVICPRAAAAKLRAGLRNPRLQLLPVDEPLSQIVRTIHEAAFDVLYYWEVATDVTNFVLPLMRLAPVQCTSWGIQVTTGIAEMDYYLSSRLVEPDDAEQHYTETLRLAPSLLTFQQRVQPPPRLHDRAHFGLDDSQHIYLCAHQLGKFHPDFDPVLAAILRSDGHGRIVITSDRGGRIAEKLRRRFVRTLDDVAGRVVFLPHLDRADYLALTAAADVLLDPPHFGGVNTTYDGLSLNQPIVTRPSAFHRGRYTYGCFGRMGYEETVARSDEDYIDKAVRLATDVEYRHKVKQDLAEASEQLFEDGQAVEDHRYLFEALIAEARAG